MTMGGKAQDDNGGKLSFRGANFPLSVILRSFAPKNLRDGAFETGEKILRCAQNDNRRKAQNDNGGKAQNDNGGGRLRMTMEGNCHSEERISPSLSF